jgi:hypothetical protein
MRWRQPRPIQHEVLMVGSFLVVGAGGGQAAGEESRTDLSDAGEQVAERPHPWTS